MGLLLPWITYCASHLPVSASWWEAPCWALCFQAESCRQSTLPFSNKALRLQCAALRSAEIGSLCQSQMGSLKAQS